MLYIHSLNIYTYSCNILAMIQVLGGNRLACSYDANVSMSQNLGQPKTFETRIGFLLLLQAWIEGFFFSCWKSVHFLFQTPVVSVRVLIRTRAGQRYGDDQRDCKISHTIGNGPCRSIVVAVSNQFDQCLSGDDQFLVASAISSLEYVLGGSSQ